MKLRACLSLIGLSVIGLGVAVPGVGGVPPSAATATRGARPPASQETEPPTMPASIAAGNEIYHEYCAACHGPQAQGGSMDEGMPIAPPNLTAPHLVYAPNDRAMFNTIKHGIPPNYYMIPWDGTLTGAQIWNVVHYIDSLRAKK